jgi:hypothetical protein
MENKQLTRSLHVLSGSFSQNYSLRRIQSCLVFSHNNEPSLRIPADLRPCGLFDVDDVGAPVSDHAADLLLRNGHIVTVAQRAELIQRFLGRIFHFIRFFIRHAL